jgi:hypothetical protein
MKFQLPGTQYLINMAIGLAIVLFAARFLPEKFKAYFRV